MNEQYDKNILLQNPNDFWGYDEEHYRNILVLHKILNQKHKPQDKVLKNNHHTKLFILEKEDDIETQQSRYYGVKNNKLTYVPQYQTTLDMNSSIYYDGYMFPKRKSLLMQLNYDGQTSLLSKSLQNKNVFYDLSDPSISIHQPGDYSMSNCDLFGEDNMFIPFQNEGSMKSYFKQVLINDTYIMKCIKEEKLTSMYLL